MNRKLIHIVIKRISFNSSSLLHTSSLCNGQGKVMKKVMGETKKRKFKYHEEPLLPRPTTFTVGASEGKKSPNSRRVNVLNKLFMRHITDLMSAGECSSAFVGHGIEVNRVSVTADFSFVRIYWSTTKSESDIIEEILYKNAGLLRHELAQLKVVGVIPRLQFVKDKQFSMLAKVDKLLAIADYGDDYVPIDLGTRIKSDLQLTTTLNPYMQKIEQLEKTHPLEELDDIPSMPNNVFGLDYTTIMDQIVIATKKSKAVHRIQPLSEETEPSTLCNTNPISFGSNLEEKEAFRSFLQKQQIMKNKMQRVLKKQISELEQVEYELNHEDVDENIEESDFIDDDSDNVKIS